MMARMNWDRVRTESRVSNHGSEYIAPSLGIGDSDPQLGEDLLQKLSLSEKLAKKKAADLAALNAKAAQFAAAFETTTDPKMKALLLVSSLERAVRAGRPEQASEICQVLIEHLQATKHS